MALLPPLRKLLLAAGLALPLAGCNTIKGAGQDIKSGGQAIQQEATEAQQSM